MSKRTIFLIIALLAVTLGLLAIALAPSKIAPPSEKPKVKTPVSYAHTNLIINPPTASSSGLYSSTVSVSSGSNSITGVQLELSFDTSKLQIVDIKPGSFFPTPTELGVKKIDNVNGTVSYALVVGLGKEGISGSGDVATITFREIGKTGDLAQINFEPKSLVTSSETDQSVIKTKTSATFLMKPFTSGSSTPQPSTQSGK